MRLANLVVDGRVIPAVLDPGRGWIALAELNTGLPSDVSGLIGTGLGAEVIERVHSAAHSAPPVAPDDPGTVPMGPPFRAASLIWGIGLNYVDHARDLGAPHPTEPASFIKGDHTIVGPGEPIVLPEDSSRVTSEAELGLIIGRTADHVDTSHALDHVAAVICILDQTAEDILQRNPRFLTRAKNYPTFLSLGGEVVTVDEVRDSQVGLDHLRVATWRNGERHREAAVSGMAFGPEELVAFHSRVFPMRAGTVISTGTPGAVVIQDGDVVECRIDGVGRLANPVRAAR